MRALQFIMTSSGPHTWAERENRSKPRRACYTRPVWVPDPVYVGVTFFTYACVMGR